MFIARMNEYKDVLWTTVIVFGNTFSCCQSIYTENTNKTIDLLLVLLKTCDWILFFFLFFSLSKSFSLSCSSSMNFQRTNAILLVTHTYIHSFIHSSVRFEIKKKKIFFFFVLFCFFFHNSVFVVYRHKQQ